MTLCLRLFPLVLRRPRIKSGTNKPVATTGTNISKNHRYDLNPPNVIIELLY